MARHVALLVQVLAASHCTAAASDSLPVVASRPILLDALEDACGSGGPDSQELQAVHLLQQKREARTPKARGEKHPWPHSRGASPEYGTTRHVGPKSLNASMAWTWHHPDGKYHTSMAGSAVIDAEGSIYLGTNDGVRKFSPSGGVLWHYRPPGDMNNQVSLEGGYLFGNTFTGWGFAVDLDSGDPLWVLQYIDTIGRDVGYPAAHAGVFVMGIDSHTIMGVGNGNNRVLAVNAWTGEKLWDFRTELPVWNFMPLFPSNESVVFMDYSGGMYKLDLHNGTVLWHSPSAGAALSFTDGGAILGPNGAAYSCSNPGVSEGNDGQPGLLRAVDLESGKERWKRVLPQPCNSWPAVGHLEPGRLSVVVTVAPFGTVPGLRTELPKVGGVLALDADTGALLWQYQTPPYPRGATLGDAEGLSTRLRFDPQHPVCLPSPWSAPTISGDGAVYAGYRDGKIYVIRGPPAGEVTEGNVESLAVDFPTSPGVEVDFYFAGAGFLHGGTAWDTGMMAIATCDTLFVFQYDEP